MYQRLVDKDQLAIAIDSNLEFAFDPTLFMVIAQPKAGVATEAVERAIYDEFGKTRSQPVTDQEIAKAKNILLANFYREMKTISDRANTLGSYEVFFGDYRKLFDAAQEYNKVTKEDVRRVAEKYFGDKNRTVATLVPEAGDGGQGSGTGEKK
jgi:zinc protease